MKIHVDVATFDLQNQPEIRKAISTPVKFYQPLQIVLGVATVTLVTIVRTYFTFADARNVGVTTGRIGSVESPRGTYINGRRVLFDIFDGIICKDVRRSSFEIKFDSMYESIV